MYVLPIVASGGLAVVVSLLSVSWLLRLGDRLGLIDEPNHRSLHYRRTPRSGGVGLWIAVILGWSAATWLGAPPPHFELFLGALAAVGAISLLDDLWQVSPMVRLLIHLLAGCVPVLGGFALTAIHLPGLAIEVGGMAGAVLTIVFVGWFINLFNFMDGMDGFASGMALFGFGALGALGVRAGEAGFAAASGVVAMAAAGFLVFNFPPARIFLGDVGSAPLGFVAGGFAVWADTAGIAPLWISVMIFAPFFLDATVTLVRRLIRREKVWEAHRSHYYQRAIQVGWTHRRTVLAEYVLMTGCALTAFLIGGSNSAIQWSSVCIWLFAYVLCGLNVHMRERVVHSSRLLNGPKVQGTV